MKFSVKYFCFLVTLLLVQTIQKINSQDPIFTQFYSNPVYLNPAFSGSNKCPRIVSNYRDQWPGISGNFVTTAITYDQGTNFFNGGFGITILSDQISRTMKSNELSFSYAYHQNITRELTANFGFQGSYIQKSVDVNNLTFSDMIHSRRGFVFSTNDIVSADPQNIFDFSSGVVVYSKKSYLGFSCHHLAEPRITFLRKISLDDTQNKLSRRYTFHGGTEIKFNKSPTLNEEKIIQTLSPSFIYLRQGNFQQLNLGLYYKRGIYIIGGWFRFHPNFNQFSSDSFIVTAGIQRSLIRVGYSYDVTTSKLSIFSGGSHEISLAVRLYCKPKKETIRVMTCPTF